MAMKVILCGLLKGSLPNLLYESFLNQEVTSFGPVAGLATLYSNVNHTLPSDTAVHWDTVGMQNTVSPDIDLQVLIDSPSGEVDFFTNSSPVPAAPKALPQVPCKHVRHLDTTTSLPFVDLLIAVCICRLLLCIYHGSLIIGKGYEDPKQENDGNDFLQLDGHFVEYHLFPVLDEYYEHCTECTSIEEVLDPNDPPQQVRPAVDDPLNDPQQEDDCNYPDAEADLPVLLPPVHPVDQVQLRPEQNKVLDPDVPMQSRFSRPTTARTRPYLSRKAKVQAKVEGFYTESLARPTKRLRPYHSRRCKQKTTQTGFYKD